MKVYKDAPANRKMAVAVTGAGLGRYVVCAGQEEVQSFEDFWDPHLRAVLDADPHRYVVQEPLIVASGDIVVMKRLGVGSTGQAWTCTLHGHKYVIKFPPGIKPATVFGVSTSNVDQGGTPTDVQPAGTKTDARPGHMDRLAEQYNAEFDNFERMMEPKIYRRAGKHYADTMLRPAKGPLHNAEQYRAFFRAMENLQSHPGFKHMHKLYHVQMLDQGFPAIFSEPCKGSLYTYLPQMERGRKLRPLASGAPSEMWERIAAHISDAVTYMVSMGFIHVDIKPDNILYQLTKDGVLFMLGDYGECQELGYTPHPPKKRGTALYNPPGQMEFEFSAHELALFQLASTLLSVVDVGGDAPRYLVHEYESEGTIAEYVHGKGFGGGLGKTIRKYVKKGTPHFNLLARMLQYEAAVSSRQKILTNYGLFLQINKS